MKFDDLREKDITSESSDEILKRVNKCRNKQIERYSEQDIYSNSELEGRNINKYCQINKDAQDILKTAFDKLGFSARAYNKILKVARTIADLENTEKIESTHILEAIQYRSMDRKYFSI
ncbi:hypothetical protein [Senegalia massiliensis]|uniref:magnesium chelatase subunit ChlI family protein n=1 Tax=Senegalia massiliensis TaxID=1720316 RepID=UPI00325BB06E